MSRQFARDLFLEVPRGNIPGQSYIHKFGENPDIDTGGFEDLWDAGGAYVPPTQARTHDVTSDNAADDGTVVSSGTSTGGSATTLVDSGATFISDGVAAADLILNDTDMSIAVVVTIDSETTITVARWADPGDGLTVAAMESGKAYRVVTPASTGASLVWILGLDSGFLAQNEFVVMNGVANVATANTHIRQHRLRAFGGGTVTAAVGTITSTAQTDGTVTCQIINGSNQSLMAIYTTALNQTGYLIDWWATISKKQTSSSIVILRAGVIDGMGYILQKRSLQTTGTSGFNHSFRPYWPIPGGVDIWIEADTDTNDLAVAGGFCLYLLDNGG